MHTPPEQSLRFPTRPGATAASIRLDQALRRELSLEDATTLLEALQELSYLGDLGSVTEVVRRHGRRLIGADGVTFVLRDGDACYYAEEDAIAPLWKGRRFPASVCISGWSMLHRETVVVPDVFADPRIPVEAYRPTFVKSLAMAPVRVEDPIAAIGAYWATPHVATPRELALLQALANATSVALANTELFLEAERSRGRFVRLIEALPQLVWCSGPDGKALFFNRPWYDFTGLSEADSLGEGWHQAIHPAERETVLGCWHDAISRGTPCEAECRLRSAGGDYRWMILRGVSLRGESGNAPEWVGTCTDIHVRKESEQAMAEAIRMRDEFLSIAAHELRTPLTVLQLQTQAAARFLQLAPDDEARRKAELRLERAAGSVRKLSELVEKLLDVSRLASNRLELSPDEFDLVELAREVVEHFEEEAARAGSRVALRAHDDSVRGHWDRLRLEQVLCNLVSNAIKYGNGSQVELTIRRTADVAVVEVKDGGIGIAPEDLDRIFARFERAVSPRTFGGLGLGLYISGQIVAAHGGRIDVTSRPGAGSTFTLELPIAPVSP